MPDFTLSVQGHAPITGTLELPSTAGLMRVVWDEETSDYGGKCRTLSDGYVGPDNPPAVWRFHPYAYEQTAGRVNLAIPYDWKGALIALNGGDLQKFNYLTDSGRAQFNDSGWPKMQYLVMSGNKLKGVRVELPNVKTGRTESWFRFQTLKPSDLTKVAGWTIATHPHLVHRFTCVTWKIDPVTGEGYTKHIESTGTPRGQVYYFVVSVEGFGLLPWRHVKPV